MKPENIIDTLLPKLNGSGNLKYEELEATLSGEWYPDVQERRKEKSRIVRTIINDYGIPIIGEDLGGKKGREVLLDCNTGIVKVYRKR